MEPSAINNKSIRKKRLQRLALWTFGWVLTEALVVFGHREIWNGENGITALTLAVNLILGIGMVLTYRKLMEQFDELERKIQLESMGLTLGLTLVVGLAYSALDVTNLISGDAEISNLVLFMGLCYIVTIFINTRRYC